MSSEDMDHGATEDTVKRAERWLSMEWIVAGERRWAFYLTLLVVATTLVYIVCAIALSHLNHTELNTFLQHREEEPHSRGPLFYRVRHRVQP